MSKSKITNSQDDYTNEEVDDYKVTYYFNSSDINFTDNPRLFLRKKEQEDLVYGFRKKFFRTLKNNNKKIQDVQSTINPDNVEKAFGFDSAYYLAVKLLPKTEKAILYYVYIARLPLSVVAKKLHVSYPKFLALKQQTELHLKNNFYTILNAIKISKLLKSGGDSSNE